VKTREYFFHLQLFALEAPDDIVEDIKERLVEVIRIDRPSSGGQNLILSITTRNVVWMKKI
jgi:hypothetical protein